VLKDAASAAIYGAQSPTVWFLSLLNQEKKEKRRLLLMAVLRHSEIARKADMLNAQEYM
jgi:hypothetical protein